MPSTLHLSLIGSYQGKVPEGTALLENDRDYVAVCQQVRTGQKIAVWVRNRVHFEWLTTYGTLLQLDLQCAIKTPRLILAESWQVTVPDWLTDDMVEAQGLLELEVPGKHPEDFASTALVALFGGAFSCHHLDEKALISILSTLTSPRAAEIMGKYPVAKTCLRDLCDRWQAAGHQPWREPVCSQLLTAPEGLQRDITHYILLGAYPAKMLEFKVPLQQAATLRSMDRKELAHLPLHAVAKDDSVDQIELFFAEIGSQVKSEKEWGKLLGTTSGLLLREFELLREILASGTFPVNEGMIRHLRERFAEVGVIPEIKLRSLGDLIVPDKPRIPTSDSNWGWDEWIAWASESYLPYRQWQQKAGRFDADVETAVAAFTDWYLSAYETIHADQNRSNVHALNSLSRQIKTDKLSLLYIVDCWPAAFADLLREAFAARGFHRHANTLLCAPLPTVTDVCKPLLISGEWQSESTSYEKAVSRRAKQSWPGKQVRYVGNDLNALRNAPIHPDGSVFVLNFLPGDKILHEDIQAMGSTYEEELFRLYSRLAEVARELFEQANVPAEEFGIYVLSDHGATMILPEETQTIDSGIMKKLFPDEKHRFAAMEDHAVGTVPENLWSFGYKFKQAFQESAITYFIPRGHNTIRGGVPKGHVHGGATPEEVLVPVMAWRPVRVPWKPPAIRFAGLELEPKTGVAGFYIKRMIALKLEIQNPNSQAMDIRKIGIHEPVADVRFASTGKIPAGKTLEFEIQCLFGTAAQKAEELVVYVSYSFDGNEATTACRTAAVFKSAMSGGFSLKDL